MQEGVRPVKSIQISYTNPPGATPPRSRFMAIQSMENRCCRTY